MLSKLRGLGGGDVAFLPDQTKQIIEEFAKTEKPEIVVQEEVNPLTQREFEILKMIVKGSSNQEIGSQLHISVHTVKNHVHNILDKMQVSDRRQATEEAIKRRLIAPVRR